MSNRTNIYYWKCDRPNAFATLGKECSDEYRSVLEQHLTRLCDEFFGKDNYLLNKFFGQGNHKNYVAISRGKEYLLRLEDSKDHDEYVMVETEVIRQVKQIGIPSQTILKADASRTQYPFSYQIMEKPFNRDVNVLYKAGKLNTSEIMRQLGGYIANWQKISYSGYGLFNQDFLNATGTLNGLYSSYEEYYYMNFEKHLDFLTQTSFITEKFADDIRNIVEKNAELLKLDKGVLVHKDIAFWNVLGDETSIEAIIDWDDTIMGDPTDDLSLMACYHSWSELKPLFEGYKGVSPLPDNFEKRFWLHLLRNLIFKSVIRVGAGYFDKNSDFFLVQSDCGGMDLKSFTLSRLESAYEGLSGNFNINQLI